VRVAAKLSAGLAKLVFALVGMALLAAAALFVVGSFLATWPVLRLPPRQRHLRAVMDLAGAVMQAVAVFGPERVSTMLEQELEPEEGEQ
jgi:hypothetical protein